MTLTLADLDGEYRVSTVSDYSGPVPLKSDGQTVVKDGKTSRTDTAGCLWQTELRIVSDSEVEFISVADPFDARPDFCLTNAKGDLIRLSGQIQNGKLATVITMTKI